MGLKGMDPRDRIFAFEQAYYRFRNNLAYRQEMIRCGIDAMLDGVESKNVVLLASAVDSDEDAEIVNFFIKAAPEVGCDLPQSVDQEYEWVARYSIRYLTAGLELPDFDISKQTDRNLRICLTELKRHAHCDGNLARFMELFGQYFTGLRFLHYGDWLNTFLVVATSPCGEKIDPIVTSAVRRIALLIAGSSYGAMELEHYEESLSIAGDLLSYNAGQSDP